MLQQKSSKASEILRYTIIALILVAILFPIVWLILTSFKPADDIMVWPPHFTFKPTFDNYTYVLQKANFLDFIGNTLLDAGVSTVFVIVLSSLAAYSFARYNPGGGNILFFILTTKMFPAIAVVLPYFLIFKEIGNTEIGKFLQIGLDKPGALIISYTMFNLPFAIWLMVSFFQDIPRELEDSA
jgi:multiple sugar transport system permease protein